jgi:hypothetical protein
MAVRACRQMVAWPPVAGAVSMAWGYVEGYLQNKPRAASPELVKFIRRQQLRRLMFQDSVWT